MKQLHFWSAVATAALLTACGGGGDAAPTRADAGDVADAAPDPDAAPGCVTDDGCFACAPVELEQFLNRCTDAQCFGFDDAARLPLYNDGDLPPLP